MSYLIGVMDSILLSAADHVFKSNQTIKLIFVSSPRMCVYASLKIKSKEQSLWSQNVSACWDISTHGLLHQKHPT